MIQHPVLQASLVDSVVDEDPHARARALGADCAACPLNGLGEGPVYGKIAQPSGNKRLVIVDDVPTSAEIRAHEPCTGAVRTFIASCAGDNSLDAVSFIKVALCKPQGESLTEFEDYQRKRHRQAVRAASKKKETPPPPPIAPSVACRARFLAEMDQANGTHFLALGAEALKAVAEYTGADYDRPKFNPTKDNVANLDAQHGSPVVLGDGRIVMAAYHPRYAISVPSETGHIKRDITRAFSIFDRGIQWRDVPYYLNPTFEEALEYLQNVKTKATKVAVDIETSVRNIKQDYIFDSEITCINFAAEFDSQLQVMVIPFHSVEAHQFLVPKWTSEQFTTLRDQVREMLDAVPTLIFQNGQYDTAVMQRLGYMTQETVKSTSGMRKWFDTLIAHAQIDTEADHKLGYLAREYTDAPLWKKDVDHKGNSERKDADLWLYGAKDAHITHAVAEAEAKEIYNEGIEDQFSYKTDLFPIVREMTNLGLVIDEVHRGRLLREFTRLANEIEAEFKTLINRNVSISSSAQIAEWLYDDCGYPSLVNSKGKPYKEGDGYSVASPAISAMLDSGILTQDHSDVLETLLKWRSAEVVRNRYLEKLPCRYDLYHTTERAPAVDLYEQRILDERPAFSTIHPKWALTAKTGRWRCKGPTIHNWSARGWATYDMDPDRRDWTSSLIEEATGYPPMRINKKTGKPYSQVAATNLRRLGVPAAGHVFVGLDFDQVELRAFTVIAQNEILFNAFLKGLDPHALNYAFMEASPNLRGAAKEAAIKAFYDRMVWLKDHGSDEEKSQIKHLRTIAKRFVFSLLYGVEKDKLFRTMLNERDKSTAERVFHNPKKGRILERERTARWYNEYHRAHPSIKRFHNRVDSMVECDGRIVSPFFGRSRWFRYGLADSEKNEARNAMIQMAAQELTDQAILRICDEIPFYSWSRYTGLVIEVHDQIVMQVPESRAEEAAAIMKKCAFFEIDKMPFTAEVKISRSWASQG